MGASRATGQAAAAAQWMGYPTDANSRRLLLTTKMDNSWYAKQGVSSNYDYVVLSSLAATLERGRPSALGKPLGAALGAPLFSSLLASGLLLMAPARPRRASGERRSMKVQVHLAGHCPLNP